MIVAEFEINEETREFLKQLTGPVGVLSVAGMYRSGKSYLLNRVLLNRSRGFDVGHTINACTKVSQFSIPPSLPAGVPLITLHPSHLPRERELYANVKWSQQSSSQPLARYQETSKTSWSK